MINFFLDAIKKVISPEQPNQPQALKIQVYKETHKGLDIKLDANTHLLPNLGNNQDLQFSLIGKFITSLVK